jgi:5-methylcytosine-specific restriction endonuclease McrA
VGRSNQLLAELLAHLSEVEARGIHRTRACSSLYTYCIYELRFSEDEAFRRVAAARLVRRFPALLDAIAAGELHLTGVLMLGPHLTEQNLVEVLARAKHRTKRELGRLVRILDPLPAVPARIEPLGPAPALTVSATPTWEAFVQSMCPVRNLEPGERPRDWTDSANDPGFVPLDESENQPPTVAPARVNGTTPEPLAPERYKVQFTATEEYVRLVDEAKALLSHSVPQVTLEELHLRAMRALVTELRKKKYGASVARPRQRGRHIPASVRRAVFERDGSRCTYVDATGGRCAETHRLEFHHLRPFALGGDHLASNVTLRCRAHNVLAAEDDFGRELIQDKQRVNRHEPFGVGLAPGA